MNEQQLTQVMNGIDEATAFAPGESRQLAPVEQLAQRLAKAPDHIVESGTQLAADIIAVYQQRADDALRKLASMRELAAKIVERSQQMAEEVKALDARDRNVGEGFARVLAENGIKFEGEV